MFESILQTNFWQEASDKFMTWAITSGPTIVLIIILSLIAIRISKFLLRRLEKILLSRAEKREEGSAELGKRISTLIAILSNTIKVIVYFLAFILLLKELGVDVAPIIAGAGVLGLAVGFGAQNLVRDVIAGFFILLENQIRTGDVAIIDGTGGLVEAINLRTTTLRDLSGIVHVFPNGTIGRLSNMTKTWSAMVFDVGVAYKEDVDNVVHVMKDVFKDLKSDESFGPAMLEDELEVFGLDKFADSAIIVKARIKTKPIEQWRVGREYNRRLKAAFDEKRIEIPFPHRTLYWGEASEDFQLLLKNQKEAEKAA